MLEARKDAQGEGARWLLAEYVRPDYAANTNLKWAIGNTLAVIARPEDADAIIDILRERDHGRSRQMFCDALVRTRDPRRVEILIELIDDDDVAGHAIMALRQCGYRRRVPVETPARVRPRLEAVLGRPQASVFARRQARAALAAMEPDGPVA